MQKSVRQQDFSFGYSNNKRWIKGWVPVGKKKQVYIDTLSGEGVQEVLQVLNSFITYQASKVKFPSYSKEDIIQEIRLLALEAIPKYDISRNTNIITFLQNHIKNRIINLCKFVSEKRRRATYFKTEQIKVKCPKCKSFFRASKDELYHICNKCGFSASSESDIWRKYNMPVVSIPFSSIGCDSNSQGVNNQLSFIEYVSSTDNDLEFISNNTLALEKVSNLKLDFMRVLDQLDDLNRKIILMIIEGHTYKDIASEVGISEKAAYARAKKFMKKQKIM